MNKLIIALDNLSPEQIPTIITEILEQNREYQDRIIFKIHDIVSLVWFNWLTQLLDGIDCRIMLDPKWHDIPNTLKNYMTQLNVSGLASKVEYITIHASGWSDMLSVAQETKNQYFPNIKLLAITAMTSLNDEDTSYIFDEGAKNSVLKLAKMALDSWIEGLVCSTYEAWVLRDVFGHKFDIITPWVRFAWENQWDQKRVMTPAEAVRRWASNIVMGRSILWSDSISSSIKRFFNEVQDVDFISNHNHGFEKLLYTGTWKDILSYIGAFYFRPEGWNYVRFTSKVISNAYINIWAIERNYSVIDRACSELATQIRQKNIQADVVVWAQMGSVRISLTLAKKLAIQESIYTEKTENDNNNMDLKRHAIDLRGKKIILSEDIVSRGTTIAKMRDVMEWLWWKVVAIACVWNRYEQDSQEGIPIISCFVPPKFELYWDEKTPEDQRKNFPKIPKGAVISEKPKNDWWELVESMRNISN